MRLTFHRWGAFLFPHQRGAPRPYNWGAPFEATPPHLMPWTSAPHALGRRPSRPPTAAPHAQGPALRRLTRSPSQGHPPRIYPSRHPPPCGAGPHSVAAALLRASGSPNRIGRVKINLFGGFRALCNALERLFLRVRTWVCTRWNLRSYALERLLERVVSEYGVGEGRRGVSALHGKKKEAPRRIGSLPYLHNKLAKIGGLNNVGTLVLFGWGLASCGRATLLLVLELVG